MPKKKREEQERRRREEEQVEEHKDGMETADFLARSRSRDVFDGPSQDQQVDGSANNSTGGILNNPLRSSSPSPLEDDRPDRAQPKTFAPHTALPDLPLEVARCSLALQAASGHLLNLRRPEVNAALAEHAELRGLLPRYLGGERTGPEWAAMQEQRGERAQLGNAAAAQGEGEGAAPAFPPANSSEPTYDTLLGRLQKLQTTSSHRPILSELLAHLSLETAARNFVAQAEEMRTRAEEREAEVRDLRARIGMLEEEKEMQMQMPKKSKSDEEPQRQSVEF